MHIMISTDTSVVRNIPLIRMCCHDLEVIGLKPSCIELGGAYIVLLHKLNLNQQMKKLVNLVQSEHCMLISLRKYCHYASSSMEFISTQISI